MRSKYCTTQTSGFLAKNQALTLSTEQALEDVLHSSVSNLKQARDNISTTRLWSSGDNQPGKSWVRSRWEVVALEGPSGPIRTRLQTRGHWWDLHGVITSPPGGLGGLPGLLRWTVIGH
ncbi:hypothetical protein YC2023_086220 [Brassica napus]